MKHYTIPVLIYLDRGGYTAESYLYWLAEYGGTPECARERFAQVVKDQIARNSLEQVKTGDVAIRNRWVRAESIGAMKLSASELPDGVKVELDVRVEGVTEVGA